MTDAKTVNPLTINMRMGVKRKTRVLSLCISSLDFVADCPNCNREFFFDSQRTTFSLQPNRSRAIANAINVCPKCNTSFKLKMARMSKIYPSNMGLWSEQKQEDIPWTCAMPVHYFEIGLVTSPYPFAEMRMQMAPRCLWATCKHFINKHCLVFTRQTPAKELHDYVALVIRPRLFAINKCNLSIDEDHRDWFLLSGVFNVQKWFNVKHANKSNLLLPKTVDVGNLVTTSIHKERKTHGIMVFAFPSGSTFQTLPSKHRLLPRGKREHTLVVKTRGCAAPLVFVDQKLNPGAFKKSEDFELVSSNGDRVVLCLEGNKRSPLRIYWKQVKHRKLVSPLQIRLETADGERMLFVNNMQMEVQPRTYKPGKEFKVSLIPKEWIKQRTLPIKKRPPPQSNDCKPSSFRHKHRSNSDVQLCLRCFAREVSLYQNRTNACDSVDRTLLHLAS